MKRRMILLLTGLCTLGLLAGCGKDKEEEYVTLGDYQTMSVELDSPEVTEDDVRAYVESMLAYYPEYETVDKTVVEEGDTVDIDYQGLLDDVAFEGGTASGAKLTIGSGRFIAGFEEGLIGANVGDSLDLNLTFPDPYSSNPDLAGQEVVFKVTVNAIVQPVAMTYDGLTDEYVSANLGYETVQAMKDELMEYLTNQKQSNAESNKRSAIISNLTENCPVSALPEGLLDERVAKYKEQMEAMCQEQYQMSLSEYLESQNQSEEDFNTEIVNYMEENIRLELILTAIAKAEGLEIDEEGYQTYVDSMVNNYGFEDEKGLYEEYGEDYIRTSYLCNKAMDYLVENVKVTYKGADAAGEEGAQDGEEAPQGTQDGEEAPEGAGNGEEAPQGTQDGEEAPEGE